MVPIHTALGPVTRANQANSQNLPEGGFHVLQPKVSSTQLIWLEGTEKQQGFVQAWQVYITTTGKMVRHVPSLRCSEGHKINASFFI